MSGGDEYDVAGDAPVKRLRGAPGFPHLCAGEWCRVCWWERRKLAMKEGAKVLESKSGRSALERHAPNPDLASDPCDGPG